MAENMNETPVQEKKTSARTEARTAAMKLAYEWLMGGEGGEETVSGLLELSGDNVELKYMQKLIDGVKEHCTEIDALIEQYAEGWTLDRISRVDLSIMRIAVYEIKFGGIPGGVAVNEAVELAKQYSDAQKSARFVNGVLGNIARAE